MKIRGKNNLNFKNNMHIKNYWESAGEHRLSKNGFENYKRKKLYTVGWKVVIDEFIKHANLDNCNRVLDVGCGWGRTIIGIKNEFPQLEVVGVDLIPSLLRLGKDTVKKETNAKNVYFLQGDAQKLSFAESSFDAVLSSRVLQYVIDPYKAILEFKRVVKNKGRIVVFLPNKLNPIHYFTYHTEVYTPFKVATWFRKANLRNIKVGSIRFTPYQSNIFKNPKVLYCLEHIVRFLPFVRFMGGLVSVSGQKNE